MSSSSRSGSPAPERATLVILVNFGTSNIAKQRSLGEVYSYLRTAPLPQDARTETRHASDATTQRRTAVEADGHSVVQAETVIGHWVRSIPLIEGPARRRTAVEADGHSVVQAADEHDALVDVSERQVANVAVAHAVRHLQHILHVRTNRRRGGSIYSA
eukprot:406886-Prorocentrum_minimum.AAC.1